MLASILPTPRAVKSALPLSKELATQIHRSRELIGSIIHGAPQKILVTGPCSVHSITTLCNYAEQLKCISDNYPFITMVIRLFIEKSRTAAGWRGFLIDPLHQGGASVEKGIYLARELFLRVAEMGLPIATEMVDPLLFPYFEDLVSWYFVGARSESCPIYRQIAASLSIPFGFKHGTDGLIPPALHAIETTKLPTNCVRVLEDGRIGVEEAPGNPYAHLVLRGSHLGPNLEEEELHSICKLMNQRRLEGSILIDCAHGNSPSKPWGQIPAFHKVVEHMRKGDYPIMGWMVESFLEAGKQTHLNLDQARSLTDPCLDLRTLRGLLEESAKVLSPPLPVG